jgi:hypothetical protein
LACVTPGPSFKLVGLVIAAQRMAMNGASFFNEAPHIQSQINATNKRSKEKVK